VGPVIGNLQALAFVARALFLLKFLFLVATLYRR